jgi:putative glutamine amidotransferase
MPAPLIGIVAHETLIDDDGQKVGHHVTNSSYVRAVRKAGGIAVLVPLGELDERDLASAQAIVGRLDGLVLTGGDDVDPLHYGEERHQRTGPTDERRDLAELALARAAVDADLPTLAICRGCQVLNVALGGSLIQHIDDHFDMSRYNETVHSVRIEPDSALAEWLGRDRLEVNSLHHQAAGSPGPRARVVAWADDGTPEGVEVLGSRRIVGVQWHPELVRHRDDQMALFEALVRRASGS